MQFPYPHMDYRPRLGPFLLGPNKSHELGIYPGDCIQSMRRLPDNSVNIILTSPPYNVGLRYDGYEDKLTDQQHREFSREWLMEAYRVTADKARAYFIVNDSMLFWFKPIAEDVGFNFAQILTWCKPNFVRGGISGDWNHMTEHILLFRNGKRTPMLDCPGTTTHSWFIETVPQSNFKEGRIHPAQLPLSLCEKIISRTPGEVVLDPFAGSASVLLAAQNLGRKYLGFELVPSVVKRARERMQTANPPLFVLQPEQTRLPDPEIA